MVNERLASPWSLWYAINLSEHFPQQLVMGWWIKVLVEGKNVAWALEWVSSQLELIHSVNILNMKLSRWTVWSLAYPHVQILAFSYFKEDTVVAVAELSEFVQYVQMWFRIKFRVFLRMGEDCLEIVHQMTVTKEKWVNMVWSRLDSKGTDERVLTEKWFHEKREAKLSACLYVYQRRHLTSSRTLGPWQTCIRMPLLC